MLLGLVRRRLLLLLRRRLAGRKRHEVAPRAMLRNLRWLRLLLLHGSVPVLLLERRWRRLLLLLRAQVLQGWLGGLLAVRRGRELLLLLLLRRQAGLLGLDRSDTVWIVHRRSWSASPHRFDSPRMACRPVLERRPKHRRLWRLGRQRRRLSARRWGAGSGRGGVIGLEGGREACRWRWTRGDRRADGERRGRWRPPRLGLGRGVLSPNVPGRGRQIIVSILRISER